MDFNMGVIPANLRSSGRRSYSEQVHNAVNEFYSIGHSQTLLKDRIDMVNRMGVVGERRVIAMLLTALDSRLVLSGNGSPDSIAVKAVGSSGGGKSHALKTCLKLYHPDGYRRLTSGSNKSLHYLEEDALKHRCLILEEGFQLETEQGKDSDFLYALRTLISEGHIHYMMAQGGTTVERYIQGPTSFITTTVWDQLEEQTDRRLFTVRVDESNEQTEAVIQQNARDAMGIAFLNCQAEVGMFQLFHQHLAPVRVVIPYADLISEYLVRTGKLNVKYRRAFRRFLSIVKAATAVHQFRGLHDETGRMVAGPEHYDMALQIAKDAFHESVGELPRETSELLSYIYRNGPVSLSALAEREGKRKQTLSEWNAKQVIQGNTIWCDQHGREFASSKELEKAKRSGRAFIKTGPEYRTDFTDLLPTTYELTQDKKWSDAGVLKEKYDLQLNSRPMFL